jgi:hypothetical protein
MFPQTHSNMNYSTLLALFSIALASTVSAGYNYRSRPGVMQNNEVEGFGNVLNNDVVSAGRGGLFGNRPVVQNNIVGAGGSIVGNDIMSQNWKK